MADPRSEIEAPGGGYNAHSAPAPGQAPIAENEYAHNGAGSDRATATGTVVNGHEHPRGRSSLRLASRPGECAIHGAELGDRGQVTGGYRTLAVLLLLGACSRILRMTM